MAVDNRNVTVDISPAGDVVIEANGFNGVGCQKATEQIEIAIGGRAKKTRKAKPEYYAATGAKTSSKLTF